MARRNDITSTEKLLKVIRSRKADLPAEAGLPEPLAPAATQEQPPPADPAILSETPAGIAGIDRGEWGERPAEAAAAPPGKSGFTSTLPKIVSLKRSPAAGLDPEEGDDRAEPVTLVIRENPPARLAADSPEPLPTRHDGDREVIADRTEPPAASGDAGPFPRPEAAALFEPAQISRDRDPGVRAGTAAPSAGPEETGGSPRPEAMAVPEPSIADEAPDIDAEPEPAAAKTATPSFRKTGRFKMALPRFAPLQKSSTVGIDIGHDYLRLVRAVQTAGGKWEILDRRRFSLPAQTARQTPEFSAFLKTSLAAVCGPSNRTDLWVNMSAAKVDVRHIRIPRVPRKQIANVVYWTVKKETPFDEREMLLDFENQGEVIEQGIPKLSIMVYTAPRREIEELKELFLRIGRPLTGISIVPFSVQNLFRTGWITTQEGNVASLFTGNDFSRIDIYAGKNLVMTRGIKAGMSSMVEALVDRFGDLAPRRAALPLTPEQGRKIIRSLSPDSLPLEEGDAGFGISKEKIFEMILPALERLTRQAERTFEHYTTTMPGERIVRIYVTGAMNVCQPIIDYVGAQLGITSSVLDPLGEHEAAACPDVEDSHCISERIAFGPALGLALSDNHHTPNLLYTYKDREKAASVTRINRAVFAAFMASVVLCAAIFLFQNHAISRKKATLAGIERQIAAIGLPVDRDQLAKMAGKLTERRQLSRVYADRYLDVVLIGELAALTPPNIRFIELKITRGPAGAGAAAANQPKEKGKDAAKGVSEEVILEGLVIGDRQSLEPALAVYTMSLEASPLFRQVIVQKNSLEPYLKSETLHFILNLKVEEQVHG